MSGVPPLWMNVRDGSILVSLTPLHDGPGVKDYAEPMADMTRALFFAECEPGSTEKS